jgi:hypothetical protein
LRLDCGVETAYIKGQCSGDHQPNGRDGTSTIIIITSITREGDFGVGDGRRNPIATTIRNCATKWPRKSITTKKRNYTT